MLLWLHSMHLLWASLLIHSRSVSQHLFLTSGLRILIWLLLWKPAFSPEPNYNNLSSQVQPSKFELEFNQGEAFNSFSAHRDGVKHKREIFLQFAAVKI